MVDVVRDMELELEAYGESEDEFESELESETESELEGEFESELEAELESSHEAEGEWEAEGPNPVNKVYPDAMMEHLGLAAMEAETEYEAAEHFLPLIPMVASKLLPLAARALPKIASKVLPRVAKALTRATPSMTRTVTNLARSLHRRPGMRPLLRTIPSTARRAVTKVAKRVAAGHPVSPKQASRILVHENRRVLKNPQVRQAVLRRAGNMDRKFHHITGFKRPYYGYRHGHYQHHHGHPGHSVHGVPAGRGTVGYGPVSSTRYGPGGMVADGPGGAVDYGTVSSCPTCGASSGTGARRSFCCCS